MFCVEFKFNAKSIDKAPQFYSPSNPSDYIVDGNYEEFYYDTFLVPYFTRQNWTIPDKTTYLSQINNNNPVCMREYKRLYAAGNASDPKGRYTGDPVHIQIHNQFRQMSETSIQQFIQQYDLDVEKLSHTLHRKQENKQYMLYADGEFNYEKLDPDTYILDPTSVVKTANTYQVNTANGHTLKILLRWKNCLGVAYPAFQIDLVKKTKKTTVKQLKEELIALGLSTVGNKAVLQERLRVAKST
jgi:hypothetical protein